MPRSPPAPGPAGQHLAGVESRLDQRAPAGGRAKTVARPGPQGEERRREGEDHEEGLVHVDGLGFAAPVATTGHTQLHRARRRSPRRRSIGSGDLPGAACLHAATTVSTPPATEAATMGGWLGVAPGLTTAPGMCQFQAELFQAEPFQAAPFQAEPFQAAPFQAAAVPGRAVPGGAVPAHRRSRPSRSRPSRSRRRRSTLTPFHEPAAVAAAVPRRARPQVRVPGVGRLVGDSETVRPSSVADQAGGGLAEVHLAAQWPPRRRSGPRGRRRTGCRSDRGWCCRAGGP